MFKNLGVGAKITIAFSILSVIVGVVVYFVVKDASDSALEIEIRRRTSLSAQGLLEQMDKEIETKTEILHALSHDDDIRRMVKDSNILFESLSDIDSYINDRDAEWTKSPPDLPNNFLNNITNNNISDNLRSFQKLYVSKDGNPDFGEIFITNRYGANVAQTNITTDYYQANEEWWKITKDKEIFISQLTYDESAGIYSLEIGIRIDDDNGNFIGAMKSILNIKDMSDIIDEFKRTRSSDISSINIILIDNSGSVIYYTIPKYKFLDNLSSEPSMGKAISSSRENKTGYLITETNIDDNNANSVLSYASSLTDNSFSGLGWILIINQETKGFLEPIKDLQLELLIIALIAIPLLIIGGIIISRYISRPIEKLTHIAKEISKGNFKKRAEETSNDEIGELAQSFNIMIDKIIEFEKEKETQFKKEFLFKTVHDLRAPSTIIKLALERYNIEKLEGKYPEIIEDIDLIRDANLRMDRLIKELFELVKNERFEINTTKERIDLAHAVESLVKGLRLVADKNNIKIKHNIKDENIIVTGDGDKIKEIFTNIIDNAIKYNKQGGTITIDHSLNDNFIDTKITDTGIGMDSKHMQNLFTPYHRGSEVNNIPGSGLGLYIVKNLVEKMGGKIKADSKIGKGTTFTISLPVPTA